jgi:2-(1,2-epoxy-1,2-dihydrophenyl)acetyl-CoA isomerase
LRMNKPLVTAINGAAAGAGFGLAILSDLALAARSAKFAVAYGTIGLSPDAGTTWLLPKLVGLRQAQRLALTGEQIDADEAERIGLVSRALEPDLLAAEARLAAERMADRSMGAIRRTRRLLLSSFSQGLETHLEREAESISAGAKEADGREGIAAFVAKRRPSFPTRS